MAAPNATFGDLLHEAGLSPFRSDWGASAACRDHRGVSAFTAGRDTSNDHPDAVYNDAEHAESLLGVPAGSCQWVPQTPTILQEVEPVAGQYHPEELIQGRQGYWDHNIEVCAYECDAADSAGSQCVNVYNAEIQAQDPLDAAPWLPRALNYRQPQSFPGRSAAGRAQIPGLRATRSSGPFQPCPVDAQSGRQVPCEVARASAATGGVPSPPPGFVSPLPLTFHVSNIDVDALVTMGETDFSLRVSYDISWSDRFAVHPCKIWLWSDVPEGGKRVASSAWWVPSPAKGNRFKTMEVGHEEELHVLHAPDAPVNASCTPESCAWPKQLWLSERVDVEVTHMATWDLFRFPFDVQRLTMHLKVLDRKGFALASSYETARLELSLPPIGAFDLASIYSASDWTVINVSVTRADAAPFTLVFEIDVARNAVSTVFKCLIPCLANAIILALSCSLAPERRLQVVALSIVAASAMLNPTFLGLPELVNGVPFVQSLVIIHMCVAGLLLAYLFGMRLLDKRFQVQIEKHAIKFWKLQNATKAQASARYKSLTSGIDPPLHAAFVPTVAELRKAWKLPLTADGAPPPAQRDPTTPPGFWSPFDFKLSGLGEALYPKYASFLRACKFVEDRLQILVGVAFLFAWVLDALIYFAS